MAIKTHYAEDLANAFGYLTQKEVKALKRYAGYLTSPHHYVWNISFPTIVNVGAGAGTSSLALREGCPQANLHSVDKNPTGPLGGLEGERNAFEKYKLAPPIQHLGMSADIGKEWPSWTIELLFIDGDHHRAGLEADIDAWLPHVAPMGYILFHDYGTNDWPDVKAVVDERMKDQLWLGKYNTIIAFRKLL